MKSAEMTQPLRGAVIAAYNPKPRPNRKPMLVTRCNNGMCGNECHVRPLEAKIDWKKQDRLPLIPSRNKIRLSASDARKASKKGGKRQ